MQSPARGGTMSHSLNKNYVHFVYGTKNREKLIPAEMEARLYSYIAGIARNENIPLFAAGGIEDHMHLLILLPSRLALASAINAFKANSSRFMREQGIDFVWQSGYAAFSVSPAQIGSVQRYIRNQREHHKKRSFEDELKTMCRKAGIEYDPKFLLE
jgi:REP element-mobilizing transposase RayT